ncbi:MAG TPA: phage holin family protein [Novosphingobium sp.]|nr:phage holin family protein [Novosphingobium sp.]HQA18526.1 phage holin family protein [Novosphingobium sp.]
MAEDEPPLVEPDAAERSLLSDVQQLVEDGRTLLEAELAYQKSRALVAGQAAKSVAGWAALALALAFFALMALTLGLVLMLAPMIGPFAATLAVFAGMLTAAALTAWTAARRWKRAASQIAEREAQA